MTTTQCTYPHSPKLPPHHTGKTLLAKTLARLLDVPFIIADATCLTQVRVCVCVFVFVCGGGGPHASLSSFLIDWWEEC